jgi:hypothetical protein
VLLALAPAAGARPPDPDTILKPLMVVVATVKDETAGRKEANRAADRLGYSVAPETLRKPPERRVYVGAVITLQRTTDGRFAVVSYLGDQADATAALGEAKKYYRDARAIRAELPKNANDDWMSSPFQRLGILVVGSYKSYPAALRAAQSFSVQAEYQYGSRGMIHDKDRGLIWPDDSEDEIWAGNYAPRRYDNECDRDNPKPCVTVERSAAYEGFAPGFYIVVGGVLGRNEEREQRLAAARRVVAGAYVKQTTLYLGCVH